MTDSMTNRYDSAKIHLQHLINFGYVKECPEIETIRQALTQAAEIEERGWKTIDSAPKDGTELLLAIKVQGKYYLTTGKWDNDFWDDKPCWAWGVEGLRKPTHWMPLPPAPAMTHGLKEETGGGD